MAAAAAAGVAAVDVVLLPADAGGVSQQCLLAQNLGHVEQASEYEMQDQQQELSLLRLASTQDAAQCLNLHDVISSHDRHMWQDLEQTTYYPLTYGLLAAMVLAAVAVTNIFQAVSAVGNIASTMQAFIVPGIIALALTVQLRDRLKAAAAIAAAVLAGDVERGLGRPDGKPVTLAASWGSVLYAGAGGFVLVLGVALFSNGVYERVSSFL